MMMISQVCLLVSSLLIATSRSQQHFDMNMSMEKTKVELKDDALPIFNNETMNQFQQLSYQDDVIFRYSKISYWADIFIGSNQQRFKMALDTSTSLIIVPTNKCKDCEDVSMYDSQTSTTSHSSDPKQYTINHATLFDHWTSDSLAGHFYEDNVCLSANNTNCASQITFFGTSDNPNVNGADGIFGLQPASHPSAPLSFFQRLKSEKIISEMMLGISIQSSDLQQSTIRFGGYNSDMMKFGDKTKIQWYNLMNESEWELQISDSIYGRETFWEGNASKVLLDPSSPLISVPQSKFKALATAFKAGMDPSKVLCSNQLCFMQGSCSKVASLKDFKFKIGSPNSTSDAMYFTVPRSAYLIDSTDIGLPSGLCILGITGYIPNSVNKYIFGTIFLQNYYSIYDFGNKRMGLALDVISDGDIQTEGVMPWYDFIFIILGVVILMIIIAIVAICCTRRKNSKQMRITPYNQISSPLQGSNQKGRDRRSNSYINVPSESEQEDTMDFGKMPSVNQDQRESQYHSVKYSINPDLDRTYSAVSLLSDH